MQVGVGFFKPVRARPAPPQVGHVRGRRAAAVLVRQASPAFPFVFALRLSARGVLIKRVDSGEMRTGIDRIPAPIGHRLAHGGGGCERGQQN